MSDQRTQAMAEIDDQIANASTLPDEKTLVLPSSDDVVSEEKKEETKEEEGKKEEEKKPSFSNVLKGIQAWLHVAKENAKQTGNNAKFRLEGIPIPGGPGLPLAILLILFMGLVPVNGHTRLRWLWLALIGNAEVLGHTGQSFVLPLVPQTSTTSSTSFIPLQDTNTVSILSPNSSNLRLNMNYASLLSHGSTEF